MFLWKGEPRVPQPSWSQRTSLLDTSDDGEAHGFGHRVPVGYVGVPMVAHAPPRHVSKPPSREGGTALGQLGTHCEGTPDMAVIKGLLEVPLKCLQIPISGDVGLCWP